MSTLRTKPLAILLAKRHHGQRGQRVLANRLGQIQFVMRVDRENLFLIEGGHVRVPLESTYRATWDASPEELRTAVETGVLPGADDEPGHPGLPAGTLETVKHHLKPKRQRSPEPRHGAPQARRA